MLRRVAQVSRASLALAGGVILLWIPISYIYLASSGLPLPRGSLLVQSHEGGVQVIWWEPSLSGFYLNLTEWEIYRKSGGPLFEHRHNERPQWPRITGFHWIHHAELTRAAAPLWLLALLCLAWPVTSFLLARRKRRRGFEVEVGDQASEVSQRAEPGTHDPPGPDL